MDFKETYKKLLKMRPNLAERIPECVEVSITPEYKEGSTISLDGLEPEIYYTPEQDKNIVVHYQGENGKDIKTFTYSIDNMTKTIVDELYFLNTGKQRKRMIN